MADVAAKRVPLRERPVWSGLPAMIHSVIGANDEKLDAPVLIVNCERL